MPVRQTAIVGGRKHSWFEAGQGESVVLVHGIGSDARVWTQQMERLAGCFRVIAWDLPGYGGSDNLADDAPMAEDYAAALAGFLDARKAGRVHLAGHSLGAIILAAMLRDWPGEASSLTMLQPVAGAGRFDAEKRESIRRGRVEDMTRLGMKAFAAQRGREVLGPNVTEEGAARHLAIMTGIGERAYLQAWEMMCRSDLFALLDGIPCPVQVICGTQDKVAPESVCADIAARIDGASFIRLEGIGHSAAIEAPDRLTALLTAFIREHAHDA